MASLIKYQQFPAKKHCASKEPHENPSIGIILCSESSKFDVEYSLRGIDKPVGVAGYDSTAFSRLNKDFQYQQPFYCSLLYFFHLQLYPKGYNVAGFFSL